MDETITFYSQRFAHLHTDSSSKRWSAATKNRAPHKPLLLLAVIDLFAEGYITSNIIELTPDLGEMFTLYWSRVMPPDRKGNLALPFFHLRSDGFWHLVAQAGHAQAVADLPELSPGPPQLALWPVQRWRSRVRAAPRSRDDGARRGSDFLARQEHWDLRASPTAQARKKTAWYPQDGTQGAVPS